MTLGEILFFTIWIIASVGLANFLQSKWKLFKSIKGVIVLFLIFFLTVILHNLIYASLGIEESVFFFISLLSFSTGVFILLIWLINLWKSKS